MLTIRSIELREISLPLREPFRISSGIVSTRRILLVRVTDTEGFSGWGECVAGELPNYSPETIDTCRLAIERWVVPRVLGITFAGAEMVAPHLARDFRGHLMAKAAVEMAIWELDARRKGVSLAKLLGGTRDAIATGISLGIQENPAALIAKVEAALAQGYRKVKIKIKPGEDIAYLTAVRKAVGDAAPLMADANNAYSLADAELLRQLDDFGLMMIEQPLAWDDLTQHAALQKQLKTPICLDESITGVERARDMVALGSGRIINIKPGRVGGFAAAIAIHDYCAAVGIPVWCGGMLESGIGRAHNVALASLPNFTLPGDVSPSARYWERDIVTPEWEMDAQGMLRVPLQQPGMGVEVELARVENLTTWRRQYPSA